MSNTITDETIEFRHPVGAQACNIFHAGFTSVIAAPTRPIRWLLNRELDKKMKEILDEQTKIIQN